MGIVALRYEEPYYARTEACIEATGLPVYWADRQGWGNFSAAMNEAARRVQEPFIWFITDIEFEPHVPDELLARIVSNDLVALHPAHNSDHIHHIPDGSGSVKEVPFIEFTAPMVRTDVFREVGGLDEDYHYWIMDLLFSKELRERGYRMGVDHGNPIQHVYRRDNIQYPITKKRYEIRKKRALIEEHQLARRFGPKWREILWCTGDYLWKSPES